MRNAIVGLIWLIATIILFILVFNAIDFNIITTENSTGPHSPYIWYPGKVLTLSGTYEIESYSYFEIKGRSKPIQSELKDPEIGESQGKYKISGTIQGDWRITSTAKIYSLEETTFVATSTPANKIGYIVGGTFIGLVIWLMMSAIIVRGFE